MKRESETAYHYSDISTNKNTNFTTINLFGKEDAESDSNNQIPRDVLEENNKSHESPQGCTCKPRILREIEYVRLKNKKPKRSHGGHDNPKKDKPRTQTKYGACFMSEIQLQNYSIDQKIRKKTKGLWT